MKLSEWKKRPGHRVTFRQLENMTGIPDYKLKRIAREGCVRLDDAMMIEAVTEGLVAIEDLVFTGGRKK